MRGMSEDRILTNLRKGVVEFCVLAHIQSGATYGFDLARRLVADGLIASEGTLYPLLARLRSSGLVEAAWGTEAERPRKYYTLTPAGTEHLDVFRESWESLRDTVDRTVRRPE